MKGGIYVKSVQRAPWRNETLYLDTDTYNGITDTAPEVRDVSTGVVVSDAGPWFRHKRACLDPALDCTRDFLTYRDNCFVELEVSRAGDGSLVLQ